MKLFLFDKAISKLSSVWFAAANCYLSFGIYFSYSYDANGNIQALNRYDNTGAQFDQLSYSYETKANGYEHTTNKLRAVYDAIGATATTADIENQQADNYSYDAIGNLIKDRQEEIDSIQWTVSGKVHKVIRTATSTKPNLEFEYDAQGQRTVKKVIRKDGSIAATYYLRDAVGNVMSVYEYNSVSDNAPNLAEQYLYGSSRIGVATTGAGAVTSAQGTVLGSRAFGLKSYELSDHLGNVRTTLSDYRRLAAGIVNSATDYYPFGMIIANRQYTSANIYRYGFNGKEHEDDLIGGDYDFEARIYDTRLGRWLAVDLLCKQYPNFSPYSYSLNNPIYFSDGNGRWVRDQNGNVIVTIDKNLTTKNNGFFAIGSNSVMFVMEGKWGYIMANNGTKVEVFIPTSKTVTRVTFDAQGNITSQTDVTSFCDGEKNCTSNSLLPKTSNIVISSDQITDDILKSEGFIKGSDIEENAQKIADSGDKAAQNFSADNITQEGDIVVYGTGSGKYEHFEYFQNKSTVDTKGGVQKGPIPAAPGQNPNFSNPEVWINTNMNGWQDPKVNTTGGSTSNGQTVIDNDQFNKIQTNVKNGH